MPPLIRPATPRDLPEVVDLLNRSAEERRSLDPMLWRIAADGPARVGKAVDAALNGSGSPVRELWLLAEQAGGIVGVMHAMLVPVPPILDIPTGSPGLFLDDCFISSAAPSDTAESLLVATEAALRRKGVSAFIASCPAAGPLRHLYERHGYEPVTLYMMKHRLNPDAFPPRVRLATAEDVPEIVKLSAEHRKTLAELNSRFWNIHREADSRFDAWMRRSLTFKDRDMLVAAEQGRICGYVIAQPCAPLLLPIAHETIGVIDDFYDESFATISALLSSGAGEDLLVAAEGAFARRGLDSTFVVCPAAWSSKIALLERRGYRTAKLWMLKL